jgi:hypothetical protein
MKKILRFLTVALVTSACTCAWAVDYANHFYDQRVYRVALGSGNAPSASDMNLIRMHNGDMVLNTDDNCLYIMHATNVYTKMTSAGTVTLAAMSVPLASNKVYIGNASGVANEKTLSGLFSITTGGVASATTTGSAITGVGGSAVITPQAPSAVTPTITVTPQAPSAVTPTITVTKETGAVTASGANNLVTPTATVTPQVVTPTATPTLQVGQFGISLTLETYQLTNDTALVITNVILNVANAVTNLTVAVTPDLMTNATCAITPDLASNSVVAVSVTGGGAVMTNATAASSALPLFATNATATSSTLPLFATNATAAVTVTNATQTFVKP